MQELKKGEGTRVRLLLTRRPRSKILTLPCRVLEAEDMLKGDKPSSTVPRLRHLASKVPVAGRGPTATRREKTAKCNTKYDNTMGVGVRRKI